MPSKKMTVVQTPEMLEAKAAAAERGLSLGKYLTDIANRYNSMVRMVRLPDFTPVEKQILAELVMGSTADANILRAMPESIFDSVIGTIEEKEALKDKIERLAPIERMAIIEATENGFE